MRISQKMENIRFISIFLIILLLSIECIFQSSFTSIKASSIFIDNGKTFLYVGGSGPDNYTTIKAAIDDANSGYTILVFRGTYREHLTIDKSINLIGENKETTIIDGGRKGNVVHINTDWVKITGFTIKESGIGQGNPYYAGIKLDNVHNCNISNNNISKNEWGIYLTSGNNNMISYNIITSNTDRGIDLGTATNNFIVHNNISLNKDVGISIDGSDNYIKGNTISSNRLVGIGINRGTNNIITANNILNSKWGLEIYEASNNIITSNIIIGDKTSYLKPTGILVRFSSNSNIIKGNNVSNNDYGIYLESSLTNHIYHNNIINNFNQAWDDQTFDEIIANDWNNSYPSGGNYWSDYNGLDNGANSRVKNDGIGDTDIPHLGLDYYPLIKPLNIKNYVIIIEPNIIINNETPLDGNEPIENDTSNNNNKNKFFLTGLGSIIITTITLSLIVLISTFFIGTEIGKYSFFTAISPLYTKKRKKGDLKYIKGSVRGYILGNPGERYNDIKRILKLPNGTLTYYLNVLEKEGIIKSEREGFNKRFYPTQGKFTEDVFELTEIQQTIHWVIKNNPGISQKDIQSQLGISQQRLNYHIQLMAGARIINIEKEGNKSKCFILEEAS